MAGIDPAAAVRSRDHFKYHRPEAFNDDVRQNPRGWR